MTKSTSYAHIIDSERKFDIVKGRLISLDMMMAGQREGKIKESANKVQQTLTRAVVDRTWKR
jgi:hypothetical protein